MGIANSNACFLAVVTITRHSALDLHDMSLSNLLFVLLWPVALRGNIHTTLAMGDVAAEGQNRV